MEKNVTSYFMVENLTKLFDNCSGVNGVSFKVEKGQIVGFIGDNGYGKTTTIKLIFKEYIKQNGDVLLNGVSHAQNEVLKQIAFFPDQNNYPKGYKIVDFALYSAKLKDIPKKAAKEKISSFLKVLNLEEQKKYTFDKLSSGMQKRALLLSILVTNPEIIILDEPTENLDVKSRLDFFELLKLLSEKYNKTIIITSHNIDELSKLINKVVFIEEGSIVYENNFNNEEQELVSLYEQVITNKAKSINYESIEKLMVVNDAKIEN